MMTSIFFSILLELLVVAYVDLVYAKIRNHWIIINVLAYFYFTLMLPAQYPFVFNHFLYPGAFLFIGIILFAFRLMGGGDSKFLASLFLLVPHSLQEQLLYHLLYSTCIVGSMMLMFSTVKSYKLLVFALRTLDYKLIHGIYNSKMTFAPVILISWIWLGWGLMTFITKKASL